MIRVPLVCNRHWAMFISARRHRKIRTKMWRSGPALLPNVEAWCHRKLRGRWRVVTAQHLHTPHNAPTQLLELAMVFTDPDDAVLFRARWP